MTNTLTESDAILAAQNIKVRDIESHDPLDLVKSKETQKQIETLIADIIEGDRQFKIFPEEEYDRHPNQRILKGILKNALSRPEDDPNYIPETPDPDYQNSHPKTNPYLSFRDNLVAMFNPKDAIDLLTIYTEPVPKAE